MRKGMARESFFTKAFGFMRAVGSVISSMARGLRSSPMGATTREITSMEGRKVLAGTPGPMQSSTKDNGSGGSSKAQECGEEQRETHILESGKEGRRMAMEFIHGSTGIATKDSSEIASSTEKESRNLQTGICTVARTRGANPQDSGSTTG